jgi:GNAT superfamily N-acetyltransferase
MMRVANLRDAGPLRELIEESARGLGKGDYSTEQIEAALKGAWGVDTQLIRDGTYFVVEVGGRLAGCGGWSRRKTLFGGDAQPGREAELLDARKDAARIRAFFVHPDFARRGLGRMLLERCEEEAKREKFRSAELVATLPGVRLYSACGYEEVGRKEYEIGRGVMIEFVTMRKLFAAASLSTRV